MACTVTSTQPEFLDGGHVVCVRNTFLDFADAESPAAAMLLKRSATLPAGRVWATSWQCSSEDNCQGTLDAAAEEEQEAAEADEEEENEQNFEYDSEAAEEEDEDEEEGFIGSRWQGGAKACTFKKSVLTLSMLDTTDALSHVSTQDSERSPSSGSGTLLGYRYDDPDFVPSTPEPQARLHRCFTSDGFGSEGCDEWTPQELLLSSCPVSEAGYGGAESWAYASTQTSPPSLADAGEGELDYPFLDETEEADGLPAPALEEWEPMCRCATKDGFEAEDYRSNWTPVEWQPPAAQPPLDVAVHQSNNNCTSLMQQPMPALVLPMMMVPVGLGQQQQCQQQPQLPSPQTTFDMDLAWREQQQFAVPSTLPQTDDAWMRLMGSDTRSGQV